MSKILDTIMSELEEEYQRRSIQAELIPEGGGGPGGVPTIQLHGMNVNYVQVKLSFWGSQTQDVKVSQTRLGTRTEVAPDRNDGSNFPKMPVAGAPEFYKGNSKCNYHVSGLRLDKKALKTKLKGKPGKLVWKGALAKYLNADTGLTNDMNRALFDNLKFKDDPDNNGTVIIHDREIIMELTAPDSATGQVSASRMNIPNISELRVIDQIASMLKSI